MTATLDTNTDTTAKYYSEEAYCKYFIVPELRCTATGKITTGLGYNVGFKSFLTEEYAQFAYESQAALYELGLAPPVVGEEAVYRDDCGWGYYTLHCKVVLDHPQVKSKHKHYVRFRTQADQHEDWHINDLHYGNLALFQGRVVLIDCNPPQVYDLRREEAATRISKEWESEYYA